VNPYALPAVVLVTLVTVAIAAYGVRVARTTSDFLVASRSISPNWNAAAISGEYLSAASFLGIAGLVMKSGVSVLWYPVGFAAGYLALLLFVAAPLRRSGAFTLPDFAEVRLGSQRLRRLASVFVVLIGWLYLVPQFQGAGLTLGTVTGAPTWVGAVVVAAVVVGTVASGGMRSITFVQAFQYWLKLTAIAFPVAFLLLGWSSDGRPELAPPHAPTFVEQTTVTIREPVTITLTEQAGALGPGEHRLRAGTTITFPAGAAVPHTAGLQPLTGGDWLTPPTGGAGLFATYSLILATFLGTMGLPHVLVRFYTNPDGGAARRTTLAVLGLLGIFYVFPALYGALGRLYAPQLLMTGDTDAVVLVLPAAAVGGVGGQLLGALVAAGAFAAFLSTASGLLVSLAGVLSTDVFGGGSVRAFRAAALIAGLLPLVVALRATDLDVSQVVGLAFAVAASSFCPLLMLGIWWRGLTAIGAAAGLVVGGGAAVAAVAVAVFGPPLAGWPAALVSQPAAWSVPLAFAVMIGVSLLTAGRAPANRNALMLRLHAPEALRLRLPAAPRDRSPR
jgi:Na+(H+)/acetate symporter ActP